VHFGVILPNYGRGSKPDGMSDADHVRRVKERYPELRVIPRTTPDRVDAMLEAGAEGAVVTFPDLAASSGSASRRRGGTFTAALPRLSSRGSL